MVRRAYLIVLLDFTFRRDDLDQSVSLERIDQTLKFQPVGRWKLVFRAEIVKYEKQLENVPRSYVTLPVLVLYVRHSLWLVYTDASCWLACRRSTSTGGVFQRSEDFSFARDRTNWCSDGWW